MDRLLKIVGGPEKAIRKALKFFLCVKKDTYVSWLCMCHVPIELQTKLGDTISVKDGLCLLIGYFIGS